MVESFELVPRPLDKGSRPKSGKLRLNLQAILMVKSFKLVPRPLDKGSRPKSGKIEAKPSSNP
jgi:hypothetical protein